MTSPFVDPARSLHAAMPLAFQRPVFRILFRDPDGVLQHASYTSTWKPQAHHTTRLRLVAKPRSPGSAEAQAGEPTQHQAHSPEMLALRVLIEKIYLAQDCELVRLDLISSMTLEIDL